MKVAYMLGSLNRGGLETLACDLFGRAKDLGIDLIAIHRKMGVLYNEMKKTPTPLVQLRPRGFYDLLYLIKLRKLLINEQIEIIHCQSVIDSIFAYLASCGLNKKIIISFHGRYWKNTDLKGMLAKYMIEKSDLSLFVSHSLKDFYIDKLKIKKTTNLRVLENGIDLEKFDNFTTSNIKKELKIPDNSLVFGTVGNFISGRDQMTICKFLKLLKQQRDDFYFLFIGARSKSETHLYDNCFNYCKKNDLLKNVRFLGSRKDVPQIIPALDAFIYSSLHDTFGIAVVEAMYVKIPVFVNDYEVMLEITGKGKHASIYQSQNEYDLLENILHFLSNRREYKIKANIASDFVKTRYGISTHINNLSKLYEKVLI